MCIHTAAGRAARAPGHRPLIVLAASLALLACSDNQSTGPDESRVVRVEISPGTTQLATGKTVRLQATLYDASGPVYRRIRWSSTAASVASVDSTGLVTARRPGRVSIRAHVDQPDGSVSAAAALEVFRWDLLFFSLAGGVFAETLVLEPNSNQYPVRLFPSGHAAMDAVPSPDGTLIAYAVRDAEGYTDIWIANRDGSGARVLAPAPGNDEWPSWSPDGSRIAFQSERGQAHSDIWVVNVDGTGLRRLTFDPLPGITSEVQPAWSPDGSRIAFASNLSGTYDIMTVRPDGTDQRRLTTLSGSELEPNWSPDGQKLMVRTTDAANEWDLLLLAHDGTPLQRLQLPGRQRSPAWRADGEIITYSSSSAPAEPWQVWTIAPDGTDPRQQTPDSFTGGHRPGWVRTF